MSQVEFQEENYSGNFYEDNPTGLIGLLLKFKIAQNKESAYKILIGIGIVSILLTIIILWPKNNSSDDNTNFKGYTEEELLNI